MVMGKEAFCCHVSRRRPTRDTVRFCLLGVLIALYMLAGAATFSLLERPAEIHARQLWEQRLKDFSREHNISTGDLGSLLYHYEEANRAGIRADQRRALWDFPGAFYFVGTVVSTIGFGMTAPCTTVGKVLLVFYGLLGCSATLLFFNLFLERVITLLGLLMHRCHARRAHHARPRTGSQSQSEAGRANNGGRAQDWKPPMHRVTLILLALVLVVACGSAALYSSMEGWSYAESLYFCFVAFSTVGFGDFVSSQRHHHEDSRGYQVANCLLMLLGVCFTYSLFNAISVIIKRGLDWIVRALVWMCRGVCHKRPRHRPLPKLFSDSDPAIFIREDIAVNARQMQTVTGMGQDVFRPSSLSNATGKCLCDEAKVEKIYHVGMDRGVTVNQEQGNHPSPENAIHAGPLPVQYD